jgi:Glycosyl transferase family 2
MSQRSRLRAAIARRIQGPYRALGRLDARLHDVQSRLARIEETVAAIGDTRAAVGETLAAVGEMRNLAAKTHDLLSGEMRSALRAILAEEAANRRRLHRLREDREYAAAWTEPRPLVTVTIATRERPELLATRSLPSILAQTYTDLEVIVVGDHADAATAEAVRSLDDARLTYRNLTQRLHFTNDPYRHWLVGATMARNEANRLARGRWLVCFDDDDAMRPDCIERLVARAAKDRLEAVYGRALIHREGEREFAIGSFPPSLGRFTWASGMYHSGLRFLERELFAADLALPGDWFLAERMLRAGVRFGMVDTVLCDIYPSLMNRLHPMSAEEDDGA